MINFVRTVTGLRFPDFIEGSKLPELVNEIASALGTSPRNLTGSPLEVLAEFEGYPPQFALWWDGFICELGCSGPCGVDFDALSQRLHLSGLFRSA